MLSKFYKSDGKSTESLTARQQFAKQRVENYISIGRYKFEETECVCGSKKDYIVLSEKDRYGLAHRVVLCKNCLTIYATPRYDRITFEDFYKNIYRDLYESDDRSISDFFHHQYEQGLQIHNFILNNSELHSSANIFEAGCGAGGILQVFAERNFKTVGCDFDEPYLNYGRKAGLRLISGSFQEFIQSEGERFDLVILSHVLEHFLKPLEELRMIANTLSEHGLLFIEVPNVIPHIGFMSQLQSAHNWYFDEASLDYLLKAAGLMIVASENPFHLRVLAKKAEQIFAASYSIDNSNAWIHKWKAFKKREIVRRLRYPLVHFLKLTGLIGILRRFVRTLQSAVLPIMHIM